MVFPRLMTAMITPFNDYLEIDYTKVRELAQHLADTGSEGIVVCGTTGESPALKDEEKLEMFSVVHDAVGSRVQVWAGIGSNSTAHTVELAKEMGKLKIDGVMAVTPYYNKPSQEGLYRHFRSIAEATPLPVMLYNVPGRTGVNMLPATVKRLAAIDNIVALKEAGGNMDQMSELIRSTPPDFVIYKADSARCPLAPARSTNLASLFAPFSNE
jgi:4-hydroxy-tetrahydrodipicolinate synthase